MTRKEFEKLISQAVDDLPQTFKDKLDNVSIVLEEWPTAQQLQSTGVSPRGLLFGLYHGVPQTKRRRSNPIMPDKITIFAGPILMVCNGEEEIKDKVTSVVKHEIAHHFGLNEDEIRKTGN